MGLLMAGLTAGFVLALLTVIILLIFVHEGGHALGAKLARVPVTVFCAGPFYWKRVKDRWEFSWWSDTRLGGFVLVDPKEDEELRLKYLAFFSGGPIASIIALTAILVTYYLQPAMQGLLLVPLAFAALMSLTLIPGKTSGFATDGHWIWCLLFKPEAAERRLVSTRITQLARMDVPAVEWPEALMAQLRELSEPKIEALTARLLEVSFALAKGDDSLALHAIQDFPEGKELEKVVDPTGTIRQALLLDAALVYAFVQKDASKARRRVEMVAPAKKELQFLVHEVMSSILYIEGDEDGAVQEAVTAIELLAEQMPDHPRTVMQVANNFRYVSEDVLEAAESTGRRLFEIAS